MVRARSNKLSARSGNWAEQVGGMRYLCGVSTARVSFSPPEPFSMRRSPRESRGEGGGEGSNHGGIPGAGGHDGVSASLAPWPKLAASGLRGMPRRCRGHSVKKSNLKGSRRANLQAALENQLLSEGVVQALSVFFWFFFVGATVSVNENFRFRFIW